MRISLCYPVLMAQTNDLQAPLERNGVVNSCRYAMNSSVDLPCGNMRIFTPVEHRVAEATSGIFAWHSAASTIEKVNTLPLIQAINPLGEGWHSVSETYERATGLDADFCLAAFSNGDHPTQPVQHARLAMTIPRYSDFFQPGKGGSAGYARYRLEYRAKVSGHKNLDGTPDIRGYRRMQRVARAQAAGCCDNQGEGNTASYKRMLDVEKALVSDFFNGDGTVDLNGFRRHRNLIIGRVGKYSKMISINSDSEYQRRSNLVIMALDHLVVRLEKKLRMIEKSKRPENLMFEKMAPIALILVKADRALVAQKAANWRYV